MVVGRLVVHRNTKRGGYGRFRVTRSRYDRQRLSSSRKTKKGHVSNPFPVFRYLASAVNVRSVSGNTALRMQRPVRRVVCVIQEQRLGNTNHFSARYPKTRFPLRRQDSRLLTQHRSDRRRSRPDRHTGGKQTQENMQRFSKGKRQPACYSYSTVPRKVMFQTLSDS